VTLIPGRAKPTSSEAGLTLVELMIATVVSGIAISAALAMGYSMMNGYSDHRRSARVMRAARASLDIMSNAIRNASPAVTSNSVFVAVQDDEFPCRGRTPAVDVINYESGGVPTVINPDPDSDQLTLIYASGGVLTTLANPFTNTSTNLSVVDNVGFRDNDLALIVDFDANGGVGEAALVRVSRPTGGSSTELDFGSADGDTANSPASIGCSMRTTDPSVPASPPPVEISFPRTSLVIRARAERFFISSAADEIPRLSVDPFGTLDNEGIQPMALGIEDLQLAVGVDNGLGTGTPAVDGNLLFVGAAADDDEIVFNTGGDALPPAHALATGPWRALRLTLVARSVEEPTSGAQNSRPAAEDRPASAIQDRFRRRTLRTVVELRNLAP